MNNTDTGDKAFPAVVVYQDQVVYQGGMTLRDYFAAKAMQGYVGQGKSYDFADTAQVSYAMADAMLKAREA